MKGLRYCWWMGCMGAALLGAPPAHAADGRITFSGAIVAPTCAVDASDVAELVAHGADTANAPLRRGCLGQASGSHAGVLHTVVVSTISVREAEAHQLLGYFAGYLRSEGMGRARLVTQTFE